MPVHLIDILSIIVIFQLLFASFYLFSSSQKKLSKWLLGTLFLSLAFNLADGYLSLNHFFLHHPHWAFIGNNFGFLYGPLLYFYAKAVLYKEYHLTWTFLLHLIPFLLTLALSIISYHVQDSEMQQYILSKRSELEFPVLVYVIAGLGHIQVIIYLWLSFRELKRYYHVWNIRYAAVNEQIHSLQFTLYSFSVIILLSLLGAFIAASGNLTLYTFQLVVIISLIFLYINRILLRAMHSPAGMSQAEMAAQQKYAASSLTEAEREQYLQSLQQLMQQEKPYLDAELSLDQLAEKVNIPSRYLSQIINESLHQHFFDFVNSYRIQEAQYILAHSKDPKMTVLEIMYQSGFNSKSSFNTLFKKKTGLTPSQYKQQNNPLNRS